MIFDIIMIRRESNYNRISKDNLFVKQSNTSGVKPAHEHFWDDYFLGHQFEQKQVENHPPVNKLCE